MIKKLIIIISVLVSVVYARYEPTELYGPVRLFHERLSMRKACRSKNYDKALLHARNILSLAFLFKTPDTLYEQGYDYGSRAANNQDIELGVLDATVYTIYEAIGMYYEIDANNLDEVIEILAKTKMMPDRLDPDVIEHHSIAAATLKLYQQNNNYRVNHRLDKLTNKLTLEDSDTEVARSYILTIYDNFDFEKFSTKKEVEQWGPGSIINSTNPLFKNLMDADRSYRRIPSYDYRLHTLQYHIGGQFYINNYTRNYLDYLRFVIYSQNIDYIAYKGAYKSINLTSHSSYEVFEKINIDDYSEIDRLEISNTKLNDKYLGLNGKLIQTVIQKFGKQIKHLKLESLSEKDLAEFSLAPLTELKTLEISNNGIVKSSFKGVGKTKLKKVIINSPKIIGFRENISFDADLPNLEWEYYLYEPLSLGTYDLFKEFNDEINKILLYRFVRTADTEIQSLRLTAKINSPEHFDMIYLLNIDLDRTYKLKVEDIKGKDLKLYLFELANQKN